MIYLDNAATTFVKPKSVVDEVMYCLTRCNANSGRGGHKLSMLMGEKIYMCRERLAQLFNIENPANIAFTSNTTMALNMAIHGYITKSDHLIISGMEHNSVLRPVVDSGAAYSVAPPDPSGYVSPAEVEKLINDKTKLIIINHASNVVGTVNPVTEIGKIARKHGIAFLVDAAQTAGVLDINVVRDNISMLAFAGHKMLFGPMGTGGLYVSPSIKDLRSVIQGGTGTMSENYYQPDFMPDMLESGTLNGPGIAGLAKGVEFILNNTTAEIYRKEKYLVNRLLEGLHNIPGIKIYGGGDRVGVVAVSINGMDSVEAANLLDSDYDIATRGGLHCAALAHKALGTIGEGLLRFSVSCFTERNDINEAIGAIYDISKKRR